MIGSSSRLWYAVHVTRRSLIFLILILAVAWISAAGSPDLIRCNVDQDVHYQRIQEMIDSGTPTLVGTTNAWLNTGPLEYYVWLPIQTLLPAPENSVRFSALLYLFALLGLFFTIISMVESPPIALGVTLLAALDPFLLWMTRDVTHLSLFFPASCLFFSGIALQYRNSTGRGFPLALTGFLLAIQAHLSAITLLIPLTCVYWLKPPRPRRQIWYLLPVIILVITLLPWLIHEWNIGFTDLLQRLESHGVGEVPLRETDNLILRSIFPARHAEGLSPMDEQVMCSRLPMLHLRRPLLDFAFLFSFGLVLILEIHRLLKCSRPPDTGTLLLIFWLAVLIFLIGLAPRDAARYMLPFHPLVWLILAWGLKHFTDFLADRTGTAVLLMLFVPLVLLQASWDLAWKQQLSRSGTVHQDLTLRSKRVVLERLDSEGNFYRDDLHRRFLNLAHGENGGWTWPARMILPAGSSMAGTVAVLLPGDPSPVDRHPGILTFQPDRLAGAWQVQPAILSGSENSVVSNTSASLENNSVLYMEGIGQAFDVELPCTLAKTEAVQLCLKTRAIPYRLMINGNTIAARPVGRRRWQRETLPDVYLIPLPVLPPGQHQIRLRVHLADLWTALQAVALPMNIQFPDRPLYKRWNWQE